MKPTNTDKPYYEWELNSRGLAIYSECCMDWFSPDQQRDLYEQLKNIYEKENNDG